MSNLVHNNQFFISLSRDRRKMKPSILLPLSISLMTMIFFLSVFLLSPSHLLDRSMSSSSPIAPSMDSPHRFHLRKADLLYEPIQPSIDQTHPTLLSPLIDYQHYHHYNHTYHSTLFNTQNIIRHSIDKSHDIPHSMNKMMTSSNRAIPHMFPTPLPHLLQIFGHYLVMGIFCQDKDKLEYILDTYARYLPVANILIFVPNNEDFQDINDNNNADNTHITPQTQPRHKYRHIEENVIILTPPSGMNIHDNNNHAASWQIFDALNLLSLRHPKSPWYYLCDMNTFPIIPRLVDFVVHYYDHTMYTADEKLLLGESTIELRNNIMYSLDKNESAIFSLNYHPADNTGLLINQALMTAFIPNLSTCTLWSQWDISLAHCMEQTVPDYHLLDLPDGYHFYSHTIEDIHHDREAIVTTTTTNMAPADDLEDNILNKDDDLLLALSYSISSSSSLQNIEELHWKEMEYRLYNHYILIGESLIKSIHIKEEQQRLLLEKQEQKRRHRLASLSSAVSGLATQAAPLRLLLVLPRVGHDPNKYTSTFSSLIYSLLRNSEFQPLALLTQLDIDTSLLVITAPTKKGCHRCDLYDIDKDCADMYQHSDAILIPHIQHQNSEKRTILSTNTIKMSKIDTGAYDIIITMDAIMTQIIPRHPRPFYAHYVHPTCTGTEGDAVHLSKLPMAPYHLYLSDQLTSINTIPSSSSNTLSFPSILLYHGIFHTLLDHPIHLTHNRSSLMVMIINSDIDEISSVDRSLIAEWTQEASLSHTEPFSHILTPQTDLITFLSSRVCLFVPDLLSYDPTLIPPQQQRAIITQIIHAIASGCLVIVSETISNWSLLGATDLTRYSTNNINDQDDDKEHGLHGLLSDQTIVSDTADLTTVLRNTRHINWLEREASYQRIALNAHFLEKPLHFLLDAHSEFRARGHQHYDNNNENKYNDAR